jgi:tRNA threonylcarbamoyladenosine biosynthesis protein TsaB
MTITLGIDSSAAACSAAIWRDGGVLAQAMEAMHRGHAEALIPMTEQIMKRADVDYGDLDSVAATVGPGAFTGIRIGLAAARGIALAAAKPAVGVTAFAAVARAIPPAHRGVRTVFVAIDTKRGDLYVQRLSAALRPSSEAMVLAPEALLAALPAVPTFVTGDGLPLVRQALARSPADRRLDIVFDQEVRLPHAADVAAIGDDLLARYRARGEPLPPAVPLYLRPPAATPIELQRKCR